LGGGETVLFEEVLWLAIEILLGLNLVAAVALHSPTEVVVLTLRTHPPSIREVELVTPHVLIGNLLAGLFCSQRRFGALVPALISVLGVFIVLILIFLVGGSRVVGLHEVAGVLLKDVVIGLQPLELLQWHCAVVELIHPLVKVYV